MNSKNLDLRRNRVKEPETWVVREGLHTWAQRSVDQGYEAHLLNENQAWAGRYGIMSDSRRSGVHGMNPGVSGNEFSRDSFSKVYLWRII